MRRRRGAAGGWMSELRGVVLRPQLLRLAPGPPPSQLVRGKNVLPVGPVRRSCWTVSWLDLPRLLFLPVVWVLRGPQRSPRSQKCKWPLRHWRALTWLCHWRAELMRTPSSEPGPSLASTAGLGSCSLGLCSAFWACPALPTASVLQKVMQGAGTVGNGPTLAWPPVPGISWVEGGHVPQASACVCCS